MLLISIMVEVSQLLIDGPVVNPVTRCLMRATLLFLKLENYAPFEYLCVYTKRMRADSKTLMVWPVPIKLL